MTKPYQRGTSAADPKPIVWTSNPSSKEGVGETNAGCSRLFSLGFGSCIGLIVQDPQTHQAYGFHLFYGVLSKGQLQVLKHIEDSGRPYQACFIRGSKGFQTDGPIKYCVGMDDVDDSLQNILGKLAPNLEWHPTVKVPFESWSMDYDAKTRDLKILINGKEHQRIENPLELESMKWTNRTVMGPGESMARTK